MNAEFKEKYGKFYTRYVISKKFRNEAWIAFPEVHGKLPDSSLLTKQKECGMVGYISEVRADWKRIKSCFVSGKK